MYGISYIERGLIVDKRVEVIKNLIEKQGLSQKAFAEKADLPYTTLRSILERGVGKAAVENVIKICKALNIKVDDLERTADGVIDDSNTIAAHHDGEEWTEEELEEIERFKEFLRMKKKD
jgi:transcriptional regulator with XRE-family HTH domain